MAASEKKPLWLSIEERIHQVDPNGLSGENFETAIQKMAGELDDAGYNVSRHGGNMIQLRFAADKARKVGRPFLKDFNAVVSSFSLEDLAAFSSGACSCSCTLPTLERIEGRNIDSIVLPSGRKILPYTAIEPVVFGHKVKRFQITQTSRTKIHIVFTSYARNIRKISESIREKMTNFLDGEMSVTVKHVRQIEKTKDKFSMVRNLTVDS